MSTTGRRIVDAPVGPPMWLVGLVGALFLTRYFVATESAHLGDTLPITQLWLGAAVLAVWLFLREGGRLLRGDLADAAVGVLVGGHVLSALAVIVSGSGNSRMALNMLWEWVGVGTAFLLVRYVLCRYALQELRAAIVCAVVVLSGLGIWQHYVMYPELAGRINDLVALESGERADDPVEAGRQDARLRELQLELGSLAVSDDPAVRSMMLQRVRDSNEPFARFALANTLGGLLAAGLLLICACSLAHWRDAGWNRQLGILIAMGVLVAYCLVLTKSRTAWVGLLAGLGLLLLLARGQRFLTRRLVAGTGVAVLVLGGLLVVAAQSRGFDREVITEAPKSLQYRLEYWWATAEMLGDHPLLGVGPGNFRQNYLAYKLPGASEEVLDPHNLFLDVWANGGLLGLAGLIAVLAMSLRGLLRSAASRDEPNGGTMAATDSSAGSGAPAIDRTFLTAAGLGALAIAWLVQFLTLGDIDPQLGALAIGWVFVAWTLPTSVLSVARSRIAFAAAGLVLVVHLLGAGGIGMPAVSVTLLILLLGTIGQPLEDPGALSPRENAASSSPAGWKSLAMPLVLLGGAGVLFVVCLFTSTLPVMESRSSLAAAESYARTGPISAAERFYREAAIADPLDPEPLRGLAMMEFARWMSGSGGGQDQFENAVELQVEAIQLDPQDPQLRRAVGDWYLLRFERTGIAEHARSAADWFAQAAARYPHQAHIRAGRAQALAGSGNLEAAIEQATIALELDDLNHARKHFDKTFTPEYHETIEQLAGRNTR